LSYLDRHRRSTDGRRSAGSVGVAFFFVVVAVAVVVVGDAVAGAVVVADLFVRAGDPDFLEFDRLSGFACDHGASSGTRRGRSWSAEDREFVLGSSLLIGLLLSG